MKSETSPDAFTHPADRILHAIMGLLQPPQSPPNTRRDEKYYEEQSERDLLIRLSVQMEHVTRTVNWLVLAVGLVLAGVVPLSLLMAIYGGALWVLWRGGP